MSTIYPRWSRETKLVVSILLLVLFIYALFRFGAVLIPLILAIILAYLLSPVANFFQARLHLPRLGATFITYLLFLLVLIILPVSLFPLLVQQIADISLDFQNQISQVETLVAHKYLIAGQVIDGQQVYQQLTVGLQGAWQQLFGQTVLLAVDVITSVVWLIFLLVVSFYLVKDGPELRAWMEKVVPEPYRPVYIELRDEISQIWSAFFRGQVVLALVVSVIFSVVGLAIGLPFALAMAVLAGLLEFLPSLGHGIWLVIASILAVTLGSTWLPLPHWMFMLLVILLHLFYQQFDLNYLIPRIIGRSVHLPPLVVILGIVTGAILGGVLGISLAAPTIASARVLGRYIFANLFDLEPITGSVAPPLPPPSTHWWRSKRPQNPSGEPTELNSP